MEFNYFDGVDESSAIVIIVDSEEKKKSLLEDAGFGKKNFVKMDICNIDGQIGEKEIYDYAICVCSTNSSTDDSLRVAFTYLKPNRTLSLYTKGNEQAVTRSARLAGFLEVSVKKQDENGGIIIKAKKPNLNVDQAVPLKFAKSSNLWDVEDDSLIDESTLLTEEDLNAPVVEKVRCSDMKEREKKRRPCKNCTCGLAEELEAGNSQSATVKSNCGNCGLGDAFRCSTCPYLGMPPFKTGEDGRVQLSSIVDT